MEVPVEAFSSIEADVGEKVKIFVCDVCDGNEFIIGMFTWEIFARCVECGWENLLRKG